MASDIPLPPRDATAATNDLIQSLGLLVPNLELSTGCSPAHLPGNPPSGLAQSLSWRLSSLLHTTQLVDIGDLCIQYTRPAVEDDADDTPKTVTKAYWTLYLDILCISLDGNCFDAAWIALMAALADTKLPKATWDADREMVVCSPYNADAEQLHLLSSAMPATFAMFTTVSPLRDNRSAEHWVLADPDTFEEEACSETITITIDDASLVRIEKSGGTAVEHGQLRRCVSLAAERRSKLLHLLAGR